ncbi:hypothetical protein NPIL_71681 [Nephila pilipes]|uniref:Uncharacterized protein n=1 Tax=Nephila pilipes TaxID=299642 RepID=A0A8X6NLS1_NEPPI|nr:hypothetical protein NPIL_71681 [Nephila pilipes]
MVNGIRIVIQLVEAWEFMEVLSNPRKVMAVKNKILNMKNPKNLETIRNMFLCGSEDDEAVVLDESETEEEEHISGRENDWEPE